MTRVTIPPPGKQFFGVVLETKMLAELKQTAQARGTSASDIARDALGHYLSIATKSNPQTSDKVS